MTDPHLRQVEHGIFVEAPAKDVYELIADVRNWPRVFPPTIHVDHIEKGEREERIRIWATANGEAKQWASRRLLEPEKLRVNFQQEVSTPPVASMGGAWVVEPESPTTSRVLLLHEYRAVDDDPEGLSWIDRAVDENSQSELVALKHNVELVRASRDLTFSFEDTVLIDGDPKDVFDFVNEADRWPERLPHVESVRFENGSSGLQILRMDTKAKDGSTHTTESYRVAFPHRGIAYKQVTLPALMTLHTGYWTFEETGGRVAATSQHTVTINADNIARVLGAEASVDNAKEYVHNALSTNSLATLGHAKAHAESIR